MGPSQEIWIVVVNYRTAAPAIDCLCSISSQVDVLPQLRVLIVDNASKDGSLEKISESIRSNGWLWASVLPLDQNGGFAAGANAGIREALSVKNPKYVMLLNPDTILGPKAISVLAEF